MIGCDLTGMTLLAVLLWVHDAMEEGALVSGGKGVESREVRFFVSLTMISRLNMNHALCASPYWPTDEPDGRLGHDRTSRNKVNAWLDMAMSRNVERAGAEILGCTVRIGWKRQEPTGGRFEARKIPGCEWLEE